MFFRDDGAGLSLLGTLLAATTVLAALSSLGGEWTAPPAAPPAATPRGTVPLPPGWTPVPSPAAVATPTPQGIAPRVGTQVATPTPIPAGGSPGAEPSPPPTVSSDSPRAASPEPAGGEAVAAGNQEAPTAAPQMSVSSGLPEVIPSATAVTVGAAAGATLVVGGGEVVVTVRPGALAPGARLRAAVQVPGDAAQRAALDQGLLLTNLAFALAVEPAAAFPGVQGDGAALELQVRYRPEQVGGIEPSSLALYRYDAAERKWRALSCERAAEQREVRCRADGPGDFLLAGTHPVLPSAEQQSGGLGIGWLAAGVGLGLAGAGGVGWWRRRQRMQWVREGTP